MKIKVIGMCNFMGRPASVGDVIETKNHAEEEAAGYLVSIGKARDETPVVEVNIKEDIPAPADLQEGSEIALTPSPSLRSAAQSPAGRKKK